MKNIINISLSEFRHVLTDAGVIIILLIAPVFYSFFYPYPYESETIRHIPTAVVNEDGSVLSRKIVRMLQATENMAITTQYGSLDEAKDAFYQREINAVIHIPRDFYANMALGRQPVVTLFADGSYMIFYSETLTTTTKVILTAAAGVKIQKMTMSGVPTGAALKLQSAASVTQKPLYNSAGGYATYVVPSVLALILQQIILVAMFMAQGTAYERGYGYPKEIHPVQILAGKTITYMFFFALIAFYFFTVPMKVFSFPNFGLMYDKIMFMIPYGLSIIFLGLASGRFVKEREGGVLFMVMTSIPLLFLSGFAWPVWVMPEWVQWLRLIFPSSSGVYGFTVIRQLGGDLNGQFFAYANLWILTVAYMALALWSIRWQIANDKTPSDS